MKRLSQLSNKQLKTLYFKKRVKARAITRLLKLMRSDLESISLEQASRK